jgi:hypothetical protein
MVKSNHSKKQPAMTGQRDKVLQQLTRQVTKSPNEFGGRIRPNEMNLSHFSKNSPKFMEGGIPSYKNTYSKVANVNAIVPKSTIIGFFMIILALIGLIFYLIGLNYRQEPRTEPDQSFPISSILPSVVISTGSSDPYRDPYSPPLKNDGMYFPPDSSDVRGIPMVPSLEMLNMTGGSRCNSNTCTSMNMGANSMGIPNPVGIPINMKTRGYSPDFTQIGILTHERHKTDDISFRDNLILPLFGRRVMNGRDKYQYYTMAMGSTKLPVKVRGRNCINEYGCDELMNNDMVYVEGYNDTFRATIYENSQFSYIPYL